MLSFSPMNSDYQAPAGVTHIIIMKRGDLEDGDVKVIPAFSVEGALAELRARAVTEWGPRADIIDENASLGELQAVFSEGHEEDGWELAILPLTPPHLPL